MPEIGWKTALSNGKSSSSSTLAVLALETHGAGREIHIYHIWVGYLFQMTVINVTGKT